MIWAERVARAAKYGLWGAIGGLVGYAVGLLPAAVLGLLCGSLAIAWAYLDDRDQEGEQ